MTRLIVFSLVLLMFACDTSRNTPDAEDSFFMRFYGADGDQHGVDMVANDDGTFTLLGSSKISAENPEVPYLVKVNSNGIVLWEKSFDLELVPPLPLIAKDLEQRADGGYVILADLVNSATDTDFFLILTDENGEQTSTGTFTYPGQSNEIGVSVTQIVDGTTAAGFIVTGSTNYDNGSNTGFENITAVFARFEQSGQTYVGPWNNNAGGELNDYGTKVIQIGDLTDPTPFAFFGYKNSISNSNPENDTYNFWTAKISNEGEGVGSEILFNSPASTNEDEKLESVATISSGSIPKFILAGTLTGSGQDRVFVAGVIGDNLTADGILPPKILPYSLGDLGNASQLRKVSAQPLQNSGFLIGATSVSSGNADIILMKLNADGTDAWSAPVVLGGQGNDSQSALYELPKNRLLVFGTMQIGDDRQSKMALIKLNSNGQLRE